MRGFHAKFASRDQTRSHYVIHLTDAITQFESAVGDIADCTFKSPDPPPGCVPLTMHAAMRRLRGETTVDIGGDHVRLSRIRATRLDHAP